MAAGRKGVGESFEKFGRDLVNDLAVRRGRLPGEASHTSNAAYGRVGEEDHPEGSDLSDLPGPDGDDSFVTASSSSSSLKIPSMDRSKLMRWAPAMAAVAFAALAAHLYFTVCTETSAGHGAMRVARKLLFEDAWVDLAVTASVLYFGVARKMVSFALTSFADFVRPNGVNTLWWISLVCVRSVKHVSDIARNVLVWSFGNQLWSTIPLGIDLITAEKGVAATAAATAADPKIALSHVNSLLTSIFDANRDGIVTSTEVQTWFISKTLRLLWFFVILDLCRWFFTLKAAPTAEELKTRSKNYDREDFLSQALRKYCRGLRGDPGVSWDVQARSALIDKALTVSAYIITSYYCLSALGVNMSGLLAVGGVSGIAIGFAAQKLVSNCIGGVLIFVTQPFVEGDHVQFMDIDGRVDMVGWHSTRIASIDDGYSYIVPNTDVLGSALKNLSRRQYVPIKVTIPFPVSVDGIAEMQTFVDDVTKLVTETVDEFSVRPPSVTTVFDGLTPKVRINAFIDASEDEKSCKANDLETQIMREIVEKLQPAEEEEEEVNDVVTVNNIIPVASLNAGVAELQKLIALASRAIANATEVVEEEDRPTKEEDESLG